MLLLNIVFVVDLGRAFCCVLEAYVVLVELFVIPLHSVAHVAYESYDTFIYFFKLHYIILCQCLFETVLEFLLQRFECIIGLIFITKFTYESF